MENTLNSRKKGKYSHRRQNITYYFADVIIKFRNWIIPFKLARLMVTGVGELSLAERLQGSRVTLLLG